MKVKTRFGLVAALACVGLLFTSCEKETPKPVKSFHVQCTQDDAKYTVNGLEETYKVGKTVSFTITENDPENYAVTGVTSAQAEVQTVGELSYQFTMPEADVSLTVGTKAVDKYSVTPSTDDVIIGNQITFLLKLGVTEVINVTIEKTESETKECTIEENKVTFAEEGTYHLKFYDGDRHKNAIDDYTVSVRDYVHGETEDDPLTVEEAIAIGHTLDITWNEKVDGKTVWHYGGVSSVKYYVKGMVTYVKPYTDAEMDQYKNITVDLGDFQVYQVQYKTPAEYTVLKTIEVGTELTVHTKLMNFGGKNTQKANGTVETYKLAPEYPSITNVDNSTLQEIVLDRSEIRMTTTGEDVTLVATLHPNTGDTISWRSDDEQVATVVDGVVHAVGVGSTKVYAYVGDVEADCSVTVSDVELVFRQLDLYELQEGVDYVLAAKDDQGFAYAVDDVASNYYVKTSRTASEASHVRIVKDDTKLKIQLGDHYLGYQYSESHHNILREDFGSEKIVSFDLDNTSFRLHFAGANTPSTELYLSFYSNNMSYAAVDKTNPEFSIYGYAEPVAITSVELSATEASIYVGNTFPLSFTYSPKNGTLKTAVYSSSTANASVDPDTGLITGASEGGATITLLVNGNVSATCAVTVSNAPSGQVTKEFVANDYAAANNITSNGTKILSKNLSIDGVASFDVDGFDASKGNTGKMYKGNQTNKWAIRLYSGESAGITVKLAEGYTLVSVTININLNKDSLYDLGTDMSLTVANNQATYSVPNNAALYSVSVTYATANA